jgi:CRISPR-associated protein Csb2
MMLTIAIQLINRTYGACPWDRAHIEGAIETIPSPTRILRAIVSGAFALGFGDTPAMKSILQQLAAVAPIYYIPKGEYVALQTFRKDQTGETRLLYESGKMNVEPYYSYDPDDDTFLLRWSVDLSAAELELLRLALQQIYYLGRSEHRAVWSIYSTSVSDEAFNCRPNEDGNERVQIVAPDSIDSLYIAPGVRNSELKSGIPGFYTVSYEIDRPQQYSSVEGVVEVDSAILRIDLSYPLPARDAMYWCDKLHKALVQTSPQTEKFRNGRLTISPVYEDIYFQKYLCIALMGLQMTI